MTPLEVHIQNVSPVRRVGAKARSMLPGAALGFLAGSGVFFGVVWWGMR